MRRKKKDVELLNGKCGESDATMRPVMHVEKEGIYYAVTVVQLLSIYNARKIFSAVQN